MSGLSENCYAWLVRIKEQCFIEAVFIQNMVFQLREDIADLLVGLGLRKKVYSKISIPLIIHHYLLINLHETFLNSGF